MKNTRKIFAIILAVVMCFSMLSTTAFATETEYLASVTTADDITTNYTDWKEAKNAAQENSGSTLKLLTDYTYDNGDGIWRITSGNFIFDLNGFTFEYRIVIDNATVTFIDSAEEKGTILNYSGTAIDYCSGTLILDESADFLGEYADHDAWNICNLSEEEMVIGEDIIVPDGCSFVNGAGYTLLESLGPDTHFFLADESTLPETSDYDLFVGGVGVNADNADDILGDGTASYNAEENTLYLDGLNITEGITEDDIAIGIFAGQDLNIVLAEGSENTINTPSDAYTYGIGVAGALCISGDGSLTVTCDDYKNEESDIAYNLAIFTQDGVCIEGATVYAYGGDINMKGYAQSAGVYIYGDVSVDFDGALIAEGGDVTAEIAYSDGVATFANESQYINISVYDGYLEANGGDVIGESYAMSTGIYGYSTGVYTYDANSVLVVRGGNATVTSTDENDEPKAISYGIYVYGGDVGIDAGNVTISAGECTGFDTESVGIFAESDEDEDGILSGGYVSIYCDDVTPGQYSPTLVGTTVNISAPNGVAIIAQMGIDISDNLIVSNPENAEITEQDDLLYGDAGYTVLTADGEIADDVTIEPLGYVVTILGLNNTMVANVPAGKSLNETYCEIFEIDDFSEALNTEKEGYTFGGFYTDEACTDGNEFDFDTPITEDVTIYAKWIKNADENTGGTITDNPDIPKTDATSSTVWFAMLLVSAMGLAAYVTVDRKKKYTK